MNTPGIGGPRVVSRLLIEKTREHRAAAAFTLVEMLVVVAIILLVAVVSLPSITSLSKSSARRTGVSLTMAALDQARGLALARSSAHYLVFADADPVWSERHRQRAFGIFEETYDAASETYRRQLVGAWTQLPDGIAFKPDTDTVFAGPRERFYCHPIGREADLPCLKFTELGAIELPSKPELTRLRLFEGFFDATGSAVETNPGRAAAQEIIKVSLHTGRAQREENHAN